MHINKLLHKMLSGVIHEKRLATLIKLVDAAIRLKKLSLTNIGRGMALTIQERSGIRCSDRFIGNKHLQTEERVLLYQAQAHRIIGGKTRPKILVDWSPIPNTTHHVLRAALIAEGRALTLYEEVHIEKDLGSRKVQVNFLKTLQLLLPDFCRAIIITDSGFKNPWFKAVLDQGWDYIGRVRGTVSYFNGRDWLPCQALWNQAGKRATALGEVFLSKSNAIKTFLYVVKEKPKYRKALTKEGKKKRSSHSKKHSKSAHEPWLLTSSLGGKSFTRAQQVYKLYKKRMQIEESFRDLKSGQFGLSFEQAHSRDPKRIEILLLIMVFAALLAWLVGWIAEKKNWHYRFQVNSTKTRRILSLFFLGCQVIKQKMHISISELEYALNKAIR